MIEMHLFTSTYQFHGHVFLKISSQIITSVYNNDISFYQCMRNKGVKHTTCKHSRIGQHIDGK